MNAAAVTQRSIQAVNDLMKQASGAEMKQATKLAKVAVEMKVGPTEQAAQSASSNNIIDIQA